MKKVAKVDAVRERLNQFREDGGNMVAVFAVMETLPIKSTAAVKLLESITINYVFDVSQINADTIDALARLVVRTGNADVVCRGM